MLNDSMNPAMLTDHLLMALGGTDLPFNRDANVLLDPFLTSGLSLLFLLFATQPHLESGDKSELSRDPASNFTASFFSKQCGHLLYDVRLWTLSLYPKARSESNSR
jgi:hypothetical protein